MPKDELAKKHVSEWANEMKYIMPVVLFTTFYCVLYDSEDINLKLVMAFQIMNISAHILIIDTKLNDTGHLLIGIIVNCVMMYICGGKPNAWVLLIPDLAYIPVLSSKLINHRAYVGQVTN